MLISFAIKDYLTTHGIKQVFVAEKCGWSKQKTNCIINGRQKMTAEDMRSICEAIGVPYDYFYNVTNASMGST